MVNNSYIPYSIIGVIWVIRFSSIQCNGATLTINKNVCSFIDDTHRMAEHHFNSNTVVTVHHITSHLDLREQSMLHVYCYTLYIKISFWYLKDGTKGHYLSYSFICSIMKEILWQYQILPVSFSVWKEHWLSPHVIYSPSIQKTSGNITLNVGLKGHSKTHILIPPHLEIK